MARKSTRFRRIQVDPSPLNEVKLDLGIILLIGGLLLLTQGFVVESLLIQFLVLVSYGVLGLLWITLRTRKIMLNILLQQAHNTNVPD